MKKIYAYLSIIILIFFIPIIKVIQHQREDIFEIGQRVVGAQNEQKRLVIEYIDSSLFKRGYYGNGKKQKYTFHRVSIQPKPEKGLRH